ncbi:uncharacterized protein ARMOST_11200 [Armillaria ostoyae]|uniref:Uncharacterized protein n=1 Tax=Armillaria ostoyae TaxID=47428 RepID=A0A284RGH1_ARMOS|nr:uncharacterized protein ARMOST_11200 [Armillaria ostoyae]
MPPDSDMRAAVKGFSTQLRARVLQAWMTKPTTDDEYAYCRTRGRSTPCLRCLSMHSVCIAYNIGCSNCSLGEVVCSRFLDEKYHRIQRFIAMDITSIPALVQACLDLQRQTLAPVAMEERFEFLEYTNSLHRHSYSPTEMSLPVSLTSFQESFPSHLLPDVDALAEIAPDINKTVHSLYQQNEDLRRENEQLRERFCLEVEPKVNEAERYGLCLVGLPLVASLCMPDSKLSRHYLASGDDFEEKLSKQWVHTTSLPPRLSRKKFA